MTFARASLSLLVAAGLCFSLVACSDAAEDTAATASGKATESAAAVTTPTGAEPGAGSAAAAPEQDVRAQAASLLMAPVRDYDDALAKLNAGVGGIFIPGWADAALLGDGPRNLAALRAEVGREFEVSIDFEGGRVQRFSELLGEFPAPEAMAADNSPEEVEKIAAEIGTTLKEHGITVDFAPVLDVDGGGLEVVGDRSFSTDPATAGRYGAAFARGLESAGVKAVFKHFPGHGRASGDTHLAEAVTPPLGELYDHEFIPFQEAIPQAPEAGLMMGHLAVPGLGDGETAASINPAAYALARDLLKYDGIIYTDDLGGMASISNTMSVPQAVVASIAAGADMPLWSTDDDVTAVIDAVVAAVDDGTIPAAQLRASAARVTQG